MKKYVLLIVTAVIAVISLISFTPGNESEMSNKKNNKLPVLNQYSDYQIVVHNDYSSLTSDVRYQIRVYNWQPLGGVSYGGGVYIQAMVK